MLLDAYRSTQAPLLGTGKMGRANLTITPPSLLSQEAPVKKEETESGTVTWTVTVTVIVTVTGTGSAEGEDEDDE